MADSICIIRLSAIGDCTHVLPTALALRDQGKQVTWIIGKHENRLLEGLEGIELIVFDKRGGLAELRRVRRQLSGRRFSALLLMQLAFRAGLLSTSVKAETRIGYERGLSRELHGMFVNQRCAPAQKTHVLDVLSGFATALGIDAPIRWELPLSPDDHQWAADHLADAPRNLVMCPCSSHARRNWLPERYAAVARHAVASGWRVLLAGGPSDIERQMADQIVAAAAIPLTDLTGKDTLKQLAALLAAADAVIAPDTGPAHIANAMGTPVIGLYAATDPRRSGPYHSLGLCVNRYPSAAERYLSSYQDQLRWGKKIEVPGVMELIEVDAVIERLKLLTEQSPGMPQRL